MISPPSSGVKDVANPAYAVIIPHYNDVLRLEKCLKALFASAGKDALSDVEVVVADNGSTESLEDVKAVFPKVRFVTEAQKGAAAARNRGVRETTAEALFFLDADCVPEPDWLLEAKRAISQTGVNIVGGRIDTFDETPPLRSGAEAFETVFAFHQEVYIRDKGFSVTANLLTTRAIFEDTGDFIVGLSEDVEWCWRARDKGYQLSYNENVVVSHPTRQDWTALTKKWRRMISEGFLLNGEGVVARLKWTVRAVAVALSAFFHFPKVLLHKDLRGFTERRRGLMTLFRLRFWRSFIMLSQALFSKNSQ